MKKLIYLSLVFCFSMAIVSCGGNNSAYVEFLEKENHRLKEQLKNNGNNPEIQVQDTNQNSYSDNNSTNQTSYSDNNSTNNKLNKFIGTYEFKDEMNKVWIMTITEEETAVLKTPNGNDLYGSLPIIKENEIWTRFHDEVPKIWFPSGEERGSQMVINNGYIYYDCNAADAKNPRKRLVITKVK